MNERGFEQWLFGDWGVVALDLLLFFQREGRVRISDCLTRCSDDRTYMLLLGLLLLAVVCNRFQLSV